MNTSLPMLLNFSSIGYNLLGRKNIRQINFMYCLTKLRIMKIYQSCLNITVFVQNWFENGEIKQVQTVQNQRRDLSSARRVILWSLCLVLLLCKWCLSESLRIGGSFCQEECLATTLCAVPEDPSPCNLIVSSLLLELFFCVDVFAEGHCKRGFASYWSGLRGASLTVWPLSVTFSASLVHLT